MQNLYVITFIVAVISNYLSILGGWVISVYNSNHILVCMYCVCILVKILRKFVLFSKKLGFFQQLSKFE